MANYTQIMGILNTTPDSLFGGVLSEVKDGNYEERLEEVIRQMLKDGADIIDVGGESTGPGSQDISGEDEWNRIEPALRILKKIRDEGEMLFQISVDTYKADVFERALEYGVDILNDVTALYGDLRMVELVAKSGVQICLMYSVVRLSAHGNEVRTNTDKVEYDDVIATIRDFLQERIDFALEHGVAEDQIILDPGMGAFISGDHEYSFEVIERLRELKNVFPNFPLMVGASRKGFTGYIRETGEQLPVEERLAGSIEAGMAAVQNGADILRVHDIRETREVIDFLDNFS